MNEIELAWAAGFFDGEGTTCCIYDERRHISISVSQSYLEPLERFHKAVGVGQIYGPYESQNAQWRWQASGYDDVKKAIDILFPYWCSIKQEQAMIAVDKFLNWFSRCERKICGSPKRMCCVDSLNAPTHCSKGHDYSLQETRSRSTGRRDCVECILEYNASRRVQAK